MVSEVRGPEARAHIDNMSLKYNGTEYDVPIKLHRDATTNVKVRVVAEGAEKK